MARLSIQELRVLKALATVGGGFTARYLSREAGAGYDRRQLAIARCNLIEPMFRRGLIDKIDREKPHVYVITNDGRRALEAEHG